MVKQLTIGASRSSETLNYGRTPNVKEGLGYVEKCKGKARNLINFIKEIKPAVFLDKITSIAVRTEANLPMQGYTQLEGVDFDEIFAPVARLEFIRLLVTMACQMRFKLYQMDVKSAFLNGILNEEVHVEQPKGFFDPYSLDHVFRLKKALYELKQAPHA
ncbi:cysteine-rich RLK (RECEPTOR-like protein kinase) 8 [Abeliophyllum distichum]|uniref:Cysteine-rich RLK (RECEPTOR-like protein kinase) 8 n=1 Tax=Abeliophyllum distichum TaxID=126358 RepID=A0ABD1PTY4_9LAMI